MAPEAAFNKRMLNMVHKARRAEFATQPTFSARLGVAFLDVVDGFHSRETPARSPCSSQFSAVRDFIRRSISKTKPVHNCRYLAGYFARKEPKRAVSHRQISAGLTMHVNCPHRRQAGFRASGHETCENACQGVSRSRCSQTDGAISGKPSFAVLRQRRRFRRPSSRRQRATRQPLVEQLARVLDHIFTTNVEKCRHLS